MRDAFLWVPVCVAALSLAHEAHCTSAWCVGTPHTAQESCLFLMDSAFVRNPLYGQSADIAMLQALLTQSPAAVMTDTEAASTLSVLSAAQQPALSSTHTSPAVTPKIRKKKNRPSFHHTCAVRHNIEKERAKKHHAPHSLSLTTGWPSHPCHQAPHTRSTAQTISKSCRLSSCCASWKLTPCALHCARF